MLPTAVWSRVTMPADGPNVRVRTSCGVLFLYKILKTYRRQVIGVSALTKVRILVTTLRHKCQVIEFLSGNHNFDENIFTGRAQSENP